MREKIRIEVDDFCSELGCSLTKTESRLNDIGEFEYREYLSLVYFAAISLTRTSIKNILEIGTYQGRATRVLSKLFPEASVNTIDLPVDIIKERIGPRHLKARESAEFKENIKRSNVRFFDNDSFFLASLDLPQEFGLIYVDGSHVFPNVAWDIAYSYNHLSSGGFMFIHDYCVDNEVGKTVDYIGEITNSVRLLPFNYKNPEGKIACVRKLE